MLTKKMLLIGGGGHCLSVIESVFELNQYLEIGIVDPVLPVGTMVMGVPVLGNDSDLSRLRLEGYTEAFVTIGSIGDPSKRINIFETLEELDFSLPFIIDQSANVSRDARIGRGVYIGKKVVVNPEVTILDGTIINTAAIIEHGCSIEQFVHVATGAILCGEVMVGRGTHIGAGSVIRQGIKIGSNTLIGIGSVVVSDINNQVVAYGNPCKEVHLR